MTPIDFSETTFDLLAPALFSILVEFGIEAIDELRCQSGSRLSWQFENLTQ